MPPIAANIMTRDVVTAKPNDSVAKVAQLLSDHEVSAMPVCDERGRVLGMISEGDLMRPFGADNALKHSWWLALLAEGIDLGPAFVDYIRVESRCARHLMVAPVITASESASVPEVADLLARHRIKRVPIVRDGRLVGIISRADIARALAPTPDAFTEGPDLRPSASGSY
jgi:CBS domain-containing protein